MSQTRKSSPRPGPKSLSGRAAARLAAIQALYQMSVTGESAAAVIEDILQNRLTGPEGDPDLLDLERIDREFFRELVTRVTSEADALDDMLSAVLAEGWSVERLETLLKLILRAGAYELGHWPDVPARVAVSQYVDLAHAFLEDKQTAMANGVLDRLAHHLRPEEFEGEALPDLAG